MKCSTGFVAVAVGLTALAGCLSPQPLQEKALMRGEQLDIRNILAAHPDKKGCVDYQAATNSCAIVFTSTIKGDVMTTRETAALLLAGGAGTQYIETIKHSTLRDDTACTGADDISLTGRDEMSAFVMAETQAMMEQLGGSYCTTYYRSGVGYVANSSGANGQPTPDGDVRFQFIVGEAKLRAR